MMETLITNGIKITVQPNYEPLHSNPMGGQYLFSYHISIENLSDSVVQLLSRHWYIFDSIGERREVQGDGVIGKQPVLQPGQIHEYGSWCPLTTPIGKMSGYYTMVKLDDDSFFDVSIPSFDLLGPAKLN